MGFLKTHVALLFFIIGKTTILVFSMNTVSERLGGHDQFETIPGKEQKTYRDFQKMKARFCECCLS